MSVEQERVEIKKLRHGDNLILGFSIGGGIDQDPCHNPFSEDKCDKVSVCVTLLLLGSDCVQLLIQPEVAGNLLQQSSISQIFLKWFYILNDIL